MHHNTTEARDIGRFIRARREATDARTFATLPNRRRHVPHLTQGELAEIIGISTVVVSQIEQGKYPNLSVAILERISGALGLTAQHTIYLYGLFDERDAKQVVLTKTPGWVNASIRHISHPVLLFNPAFDVVGLNDKARSFLGNVSEDFAPQRNGATSIFQIPAVREFIVDWEDFAASVMSGIKINYATFPDWRDYIDSLVARVGPTDDLFQRLWDQDDPLFPPTIEKQFNHPDAGLLSVKQILTDIIEAPWITRVDFTPSDEATRKAIESM